MPGEEEPSSSKDDRIDVGWRGSVLLPRKKRIIEVHGVPGLLTGAQLLQKREGVGQVPVNAKALREQRRAGEGTSALGASNTGVSERVARDKAAELTVDDRQRILEEKSRTYDALLSGQQFDSDDRYHVQFRPGGQRPASEPSTSASQPLIWREQHIPEAAQPNRPGELQSKDMRREEERLAWEASQREEYEAEKEQEAARDAKIEGTREEARRTARDRARAKQRAEAEAIIEARERARYEKVFREALLKGAKKKKKAKEKAAAAAAAASANAQADAAP